MTKPRVVELWAIGLGWLLLSTAGCGRDAGASGASRGAEPAPPRPVRVATASAGNLARTVTVMGTLAADEQVTLGMMQPGRLRTVGVEMGQRIAQGERLADLVTTDLELELNQAEAAYEVARARLGIKAGTVEKFDPTATALVKQAQAMLDEAGTRRDRALTLSKDRMVPVSELDAVEAEFQVAAGRYQDAIDEVASRFALLTQRQWEVEIVRQQLADAELIAPFAGAVRERHAAPGQYVSAGQEIVTIVRMHPLRLRVSISERDAGSIREGQPVMVRITGDSAVLDGRVARISPVISEGSRTLQVEAEVPNEEWLVRPGAFAEAEIQTATNEPVVLVPQSAIVSFAGIDKVLTIRDGKVLEMRVRLGRTSGEQIEVVEGLSAGQVVIADPGNLVGGQAVVIAGDASAESVPGKNGAEGTSGAESSSPSTGDK